MKRKIASVVAMSLLGLQALTGVASAAKGGVHGSPGSSGGCVYGSGLLQVLSTGNVDIDFTDAAGTTKIACTSSVGADLTAFSFSTVSVIQIVADGYVTIDIQNTTTGAPVSFSGKTLEVDAGGTLKFDGSPSSVTTNVRPMTVTVSDSALAVNGGSGELVYAGALEFVGDGGADLFDASKLTGVPVTSADGGAGADTLKGGDEDDTLNGGASDDKVDTLVGGAGDDDLTSETYTASSGEVGDLVFPGDGYNTISGDAGLVSYAGATSGVEIDITEALPVVEHADGAYDAFDATPEILSWAGSDKADKFVGSSDGDSFSGGGGSDVIVGGAGADVLVGGDGSDRIRGAYGNDTIWGSAGNDTLSGGAGDDTIRGYGGDDVLYGRGGADSLMGDGGSDEAWGGNGGDLCGAEVTDHCEFAR